MDGKIDMGVTVTKTDEDTKEKVVVREEQKEKLLDFQLQPDEKSVGNVYTEYGFTKNLGGFQSAKVTVGVTLPILAKERIEELIVKSVVPILKLAQELCVKEVRAVVATLPVKEGR